jgi:hypothetical protein
MHRCMISMPHGTTQSLNHSSSPLRRVDCAARLQADRPVLLPCHACQLAGECSSAKSRPAHN